jgi:hypothetical protein
VVRHPKNVHQHFRLQIINNGTPVNFADDKFQTSYNKDMCTAALTKEPFHFHDGLDQYVHVHWDNATGGAILKSYGWNFWNFIAGPDQVLGYRFDQLPRLVHVPIHGQALPKPPADAQYYIYVGDRSSYRQASWNDFLRKKITQFFSDQPGQSSSHNWLTHLLPSARAHEGHDHPGASPTATVNTADEARLTRINNVLGSVVIFAQKHPPTDEQIKDRFNQLIPLPESSCGG